jgi:hypothetical protein
VEGGIRNVTVRGLSCRDSSDGVRFKASRTEMLVSEMSFSGLTLDNIGVHYSNTSGWPGSALSCDGATNVSYSNVRGSAVKTPGYFNHHCQNLTLVNVSIAAGMGMFCGVNVTGWARDVTPSACPSMRACSDPNR